MFQILTPSGALNQESPLEVEMIRRLYRAMVFARTYDRKGTALQKQGRLATYAPFEGQEAAQVGSAAALDPDDWMAATYRDGAAMWMQGYPLELLFAGRTGDERGGSPPIHVPVLPPSITVGGHMVHAVGLGWAAKLRGESRIAITYFGDGATSEGDFHEAMNFAAVFSVPCVFFCQNNGWAISLPREEQTRSETIAQKAIAYGMPGVQIDGNDLLGVYQTTKEAIDRARGGGGPTLIEAVTYRLGPHTTADDPSRYRAPDLTEDWRRRDPLERVRLFLSEREAWSESWQQQIENEAAEEVDLAIDRAEGMAAFGPGEIFDAMFETLPPHLAAQRIEATQQ
ncbi:MAG TPA: pyruvate dehydrogenase (acetyl-transferring) E1 component subunit alpha [Acidimicrobiia bacterium]|jgi:pyruvate dehydrogenase E1 component alpha subunit|nr:pyruvate dehydrogenase (acetyl-transferring) E1 component subunit alpha [Acidimicrobiia bacterium]